MLKYNVVTLKYLKSDPKIFLMSKIISHPKIRKRKSALKYLNLYFDFLILVAILIILLIDCKLVQF